MEAPSQPPLAFDATTGSLHDAAECQLATTKAVWDQVVTTVDPRTASWDNTIVPIIQDENQKLSTARHLCFFRSTSPDPDLRAASDAAARLFDDADVELYARADMFALVDEVKRQLDMDADASSGYYDAESRYYLQKLHRKFTVSGCGLGDAGAKARFMACQRRIREIERECLKNHYDERTREWFARDELAGVPESFLARLEGDDEGVWVSTKTAQSSQVLRFARKQGVRKRMFYAVQNKMPDNIPLFRELILLRDEAARLLGYPHHAAMQIGGKMMQDPDVVRSMLRDLEALLVPEGAKDVARLLQIKMADLVANTGGLDPESPSERVFLWDQAYLANIQDAQEKAVKVDLSDYYELHHTLDTLLGMFQRLFGVQFRRVSREEQEELGHGKSLVWHDDVLMYTVWDMLQETESDNFLGYAYLDLHPRDGKYTHSGHYALQPNFTKGDNSRNRASSALVMNYLKTAGKPTLLGLDNARSLFHELGHLVHALCTQTRYAASHTVDRDFVEAPALMFEHFFRQPQIIQDVSHHYALLSPAYEELWRTTLPDDDDDGQRSSAPLPGRELPAAVAASVAGSDWKRKGLRDALSTLFFAKYDLLIHSPESREALEHMNLAETYNKLKAEIRSLAGGEALGDGWEWGHGETIFRAVISKYDAGYYSYVFGDIAASDIFNSGFASDPMNPEAGRRYRDLVLKLGGSQPEMKTMIDYLGRPPSVQAHIQRLGF